MIRAEVLGVEETEESWGYQSTRKVRRVRVKALDEGSSSWRSVAKGEEILVESRHVVGPWPEWEQKKREVEAESKAIGAAIVAVERVGKMLEAFLGLEPLGERVG